MYEKRHEELIPTWNFLGRLSRHLAGALIVVILALGLGVCGYHFLEGLPWLDALLNASMILGGMGPVDRLMTTPGKLFASFYALFSGLLFIALVGFVVAPIFHRVLHRFHLDR